MVLVLALIPDQSLKPADLEQEETSAVMPADALPEVRIAIKTSYSTWGLERSLSLHG
jgi:hypothetical protein